MTVWDNCGFVIGSKKKKNSKCFPYQNMDKDNLNILQYESLPFPFISIPQWTYAAANALLKQLLMFQH